MTMEIQSLAWDRHKNVLNYLVTECQCFFR